MATWNPGKVREFKELLKCVPFEITSLEQEGVHQEVEETGNSFEENACIKARSYSDLTGLLTLADDSGLEVDALGGEPGVRSARYGGEGLTDEDRVSLLLENLKHVPWEDRRARFRCVIAIASPSGKVETLSGMVEGTIQYEPAGKNGFGYDPVFHLPNLNQTTAELPLKEKNVISHRAEAAKKAVMFLKGLPEPATW